MGCFGGVQVRISVEELLERYEKGERNFSKIDLSGNLIGINRVILGCFFNYNCITHYFSSSSSNSAYLCASLRAPLRLNFILLSKTLTRSTSIRFQRKQPKSRRNKK